MSFRRMSVEWQVNMKSQSELDIGGRETCFNLLGLGWELRFWGTWGLGQGLTSIQYRTFEFDLGTDDVN